MFRSPARGRAIALLAATLLVTGAVPGAADGLGAPPVPGGAAVTSGNVTHLGTVPLDSPGVGGEVVVREDLDGATYFYVTGAYGLSIYDVADPASPDRVGHLAFPHSQNEDLKVSDDGTRAVIAADGSLPFSPNRVTTGVHIVDTTDVRNPRLVGSTSQLVREEGTGLGVAEHTVACADAACDIVYGSTTGSIYDVSDPADIQVVGSWAVDREGNPLRSRHALNRDATGLLVSDSTPRLVLDPIGLVAEGATPTAPVVLTQGEAAAEDPRIQHNNVRIGAGDWQARDPEDPADEVATARVDSGPRSQSVLADRPRMRPGELLIGQSESNVNPTCANGGGLSTWSMVDFDKGAPLEQLEVFQPLNGTWADGSPAANAAGCSGHWFTERDGIVAGAWYEHGVRFFDVDAETGTIAEVGFSQPVAGIASAAYWIDDEHVYSVDNLRGIDILRFDREAEPAAQSELDASWLSTLGMVNPIAEADRLLCRLAASG
jgi:hypothetical protein